MVGFMPITFGFFSKILVALLMRLRILWSKRALWIDWDKVADFRPPFATIPPAVLKMQFAAPTGAPRTRYAHPMHVFHTILHIVCPDFAGAAAGFEFLVCFWYSTAEFLFSGLIG